MTLLTTNSPVAGTAPPACDPSHYENWVRARYRDVDAARDTTLVLAEPTAEAPAVIETAREQGVERFICGFLPDELDWPGKAWNETLDYFIQRFEFAPLRLEGNAIADPPAREVIAVCDSPDGAIESFATACAEAVGGTARLLSHGSSMFEELVPILAGASLVINESMDWTIGFAVDEFAVRSGIPVLRLRHPGYSPLRYGFLGVMLPTENNRLVPSLRTDLWATGWLQRDKKKSASRGSGESGIAEAGRWFAPASVQRWRNVFGREAYLGFWSGEEWSRFRAVRPNQQGRWLDRPWGWAALAAVFQNAETSAGIKRMMGETLAAWVRAERKARIAGVVREAALSRWVRLCPEWVRTYRFVTGDVPGTSDAIADWAKRGVRWSTAPTTTLSLVQAAGEAVDKGSNASVVLTLAAAWGSSWAKVSELAPAVQVIDPEWRAACADLCWSHLARTSSFDFHSAEELAAFDGLLAQVNPWKSAMGASAIPLRCIAAVRRGRRNVALNVYRDMIRTRPFKVSGGWSSLARVAFREEQAFIRWLHELSRAEADAVEAVAWSLVRAWFTARVLHLWREDRTASLAGELGAARRLLREYCRIVPADRHGIHLSARLAAFDDDDASAAAAVHEFANANGGEGRDLPATVAFIQATRGRRETAVNLLHRWPVRETDAFSWLMQSVAWLWLDEEPRAFESMSAVLRTQPEFFGDEAVPGARWVLAALALRRLGLTADAERFVRIAKRHRTSPPQFLEVYATLEPGRSARADNWLKLLRR